MALYRAGISMQKDTFNLIDAEAENERRTRSAMIEVLCREAIEARRHGQTVARPRRASARKSDRVFTRGGETP